MELKLNKLGSKPPKKQFRGYEKQKSLCLFMMVRLSDMLLTVSPATLRQVNVLVLITFWPSFGNRDIIPTSNDVITSSH